MPRNSHYKWLLFFTLSLGVLLGSLLSAKSSAHQAHAVQGWALAQSSWHKTQHRQPYGRTTSPGPPMASTTPTPDPVLPKQPQLTHQGSRKLLVFLYNADDFLKTRWWDEAREFCKKTPFHSWATELQPPLLPHPPCLAPFKDLRPESLNFSNPTPLTESRETTWAWKVNSLGLSEKTAKLWQTPDFPRLRFGQGLGSPSSSMLGWASWARGAGAHSTYTTRGDSLHHVTHTQHPEYSILPMEQKPGLSHWRRTGQLF